MEEISAYSSTGYFFTGSVITVRLEDGAIFARSNAGQQESLSGIVEDPG
ncbi:MAG: hypothetical protein R3F24_07145 [Gammaproteobacteria bacterium]